MPRQAELDLTLPPGPGPDLTVFDLETTAADPAEAKIVEVGVVQRVAGEVSSHRWLVNPGVPIPAEAAEVHGITDEQVLGAPAFSDVATAILEVLMSTDVRCAFNGQSYDLHVLNAELERIGEDAVAHAGVLDPLVWVRWRWRALRFRRLGDVCKYVGVELTDAHSAEADSMATLKLTDELMRRNVIPPDLDDALRMQAPRLDALAREFSEWGYWVYVQRMGPNKGELMLGAGKHCGTPLFEVRTSYLRWVVENVDSLTERARTAMLDAIAGNIDPWRVKVDR